MRRKDCPPLWTLRCGGEPVDGLDANDRRNHGLLEAVIAVPEERLDGARIDATGDLFGDGDNETLAGDLGETAAFNFIFECFALGLGALQDCVGMTERVGERFIGEIVKSRRSRGIFGIKSGPFVTSWLGLGPPRCYQHHCGPTYFLVHEIHGTVNISYRKKKRTRTAADWRRIGSPSIAA